MDRQRTDRGQADKQTEDPDRQAAGRLGPWQTDRRTYRLGQTDSGTQSSSGRCAGRRGPALQGIRRPCALASTPLASDVTRTDRASDRDSLRPVRRVRRCWIDRQTGRQRTDMRTDRPSISKLPCA